MKALIRIVMLVCMFLLQWLLPAQSISWDRLNSPSGGVGSVYAGKHGLLFAILSNGDELYRSADGGLNWQAMSGPVDTFSWGFSVGADSSLFVYAHKSLYRSIDDGNTWAKLNGVLNGTEPTGNATALPGNVILALNSNGAVVRSTDDGQSWITSYQNIDHLIYDAVRDQVYGWSEFSDQVKRSLDRGLTWTPFFNNPMQYGIMSTSIAPNGTVFVATSDSIFRTVDDGASWAEVGPGEISYWKSSLAVSPTGRIFLHDSNWWSYYSDDNGDTWAEFKDPEGNFMRLISVLPDGALFAARYRGSLRRSLDQGNTWTFAANGMKSAKIIEMAFLENGKTLAVTNDGLFYSTDHYNTWQLLLDKMIVFDPEPFIKTTTTGDWYLYDGINIIHFTNEGQQLSYVFNRDSSGLVVAVEDLYIQPQTGTLFLTYYDTSFLRSSNDGKTWQFIDEPNTNFATMPDGSMLAAGIGGVSKSTDDGQTWLPLYHGKTSAMVATPSGEVYVIRPSNQGALWYSPNGGISWDSIASGLPKDANGLLMDVSGNLYAYSVGSANRLYRFVDGGFQFDALELPHLTNKCYLDADQRLYLATSGRGIYRSIAPTSSVTWIQGTVFSDLDSDCIYAAPDTLTQGWVVKAVSGSELVYGYAGPTGQYIIPVNPGDYEVSVATPNNYWETCQTTAYATAGNSIVDSVYVGVQPIVECPYLVVEVVAPLLRRCMSNQVMITYENKGTATAMGAYIEVLLDSFLIFNSATLPVASQTGHTYRFNLGDVDTGERRSFSMNCTTSCDAALGQVHCVEAHIYPDMLCPELSSPHVRTTAACTGDSVRFTIQNIGTAPMLTPRNWQIMDADEFEPPFMPITNGTFQLGIGQSVTQTVASRNWLQLVAEQDPAYPFNVVSETTVKNCGSGQANLPLSIISTDEEGPFTDVFCIPNQGSFDPNDKTGYPLGITDKHYIAREQDLEYLIRFQNTGTDTAFNITVRDTLPIALLDPATVRPGASSHPYTFQITPKGVLLFTFEHILLPDSNINEAASHGFVQFRVAQHPNNAHGSSIQNQAAIYFDFNSPVLTNTTLHTVGIPELVSVPPVLKIPEALLSLSPNPVSRQTVLTLHGAVPQGNCLLECYDAANRLQSLQTFSGNNVVIERGKLPAGVYNMVVKTADRAVLGSIQMVVQ